MFWVIKVIKMSFFWVFTKNSTSHAYILSKICLISKKTPCSQARILSWKRRFSQKHCAFMWFFFFKYRMEYPWPLSPFLVKKRKFCQNYFTFWVYKVNKIPLFSDVFQKNQRSHAHILSKNYLLSKNRLFLCPYFVKKTSILTKKHCSHQFSHYFFKFLHVKPPAFIPTLSLKTSILSKLNYIMGPKSQ